MPVQYLRVAQPDFLERLASDTGLRKKEATVFSICKDVLRQRMPGVVLLTVDLRPDKTKVTVFIRSPHKVRFGQAAGEIFRAVRFVLGTPSTRIFFQYA